MSKFEEDLQKIKLMIFFVTKTVIFAQILIASNFFNSVVG